MKPAMAPVAFRVAAETVISDRMYEMAKMPFMTHLKLWAEQCRLKFSAANHIEREIAYLERMYSQMYFQVS
jgi:hypothetical protein